MLGSDVVEVQEAGDTYRETVNRVVEFGLAYRADTLEAFMRSRNGRGTRAGLPRGFDHRGCESYFDLMTDGLTLAAVFTPDDNAGRWRSWRSGRLW